MIKSLASSFQRNSSLSICLLLALASGCGPGSSGGKYGVSGSVTLDGLQLEAGTILFSPKEGRGRPAGTMFADGAYDIPAEKGLAPGKYIVKIQSEVASSQAGELSAEEAERLMLHGTTGSSSRRGKPAKQLIPAEYNKQSKQVVEVTEAGPNEFDFAITTK